MPAFRPNPGAGANPAIFPCLLGLIGAWAPSAAMAQDTGAQDAAISVQKRTRPAFDPVPIRFGAFAATTFAESRLAYDDNIYATGTGANSGRGKVDDVIASLTGTTSIQSTWSRHALSLDATGGLSRGMSQRNEDTDTYDIRLGGRLDLGTQTRVSAHTGYARAYEPRGSIGDTTLRGPRIAYNMLDLGVDAEHSAGRLLLQAQAGLEAYRYASYQAAGVTIARGDRDYRTWNAGLSAGYALAPGIATFVEGSYNEASYPDDQAPLDRTSNGWSMRGGIGFGVTRLIRGRAAIGWQDQRYDDPAFPRIRGLDFSAGLEWSPTALTTWTVEARRSIQRSPLLGVAGIRQSRYGGRLDHELRRNLIAWIRIDRTVNEYTGTARIQKDLSGGIGADWLLAPRLRLSAQGSLQRTRSDGGGRSFDRRRLSLSIRYTL